MKKIITLALATVMALSATATAFAADSTVDQDSQSKNADTAVTFTVGPTYTVTIPTKVQLNETKEFDGEGNLTAVTYENDLSVKAENVRLADSQKILVTLTSDFLLKATANSSYSLSYTVVDADSQVQINNNDVVAEFGTSTAQQENVLHFEAGNPEYAGTYSGTVTFNIQMAEGTAQE
ncbi:MAG: hypothetical protein ACI4RI_05605 [Ruminococcus sp.]